MRRGPDYPMYPGEEQDWRPSDAVPPLPVKVYGVTPNISPGYDGYHVEGNERTRPWSSPNPRGWQPGERIVAAKPERDENGRVEGWRSDRLGAEYYARGLPRRGGR